MDYKAAKAKLGNRDSIKISYSCKLEPRPDNKIAVKMHATDIITFHPNGKAVVDIGNWFTVTTKARLNDFLPFGRVYSIKGEWFVYYKDAHYPFANGMVFHPSGKITGVAKPKDLEKKKKLRKKVREYASGFIKALEDNRVGDIVGDCWFCSMRGSDKKTWGEAGENKDHILSHMKEKYYVGTLALRAVELFANAPVNHWAIAGKLGLMEDTGSFFDGYAKQNIKKAIVRHVSRQLGL
jgi:hypothetical protein